MLALISIPHTRKAFVSFYESTVELQASAISMASDDPDQDQDDLNTISDCRHYLVHDMNSSFLIESISDIKRIANTSNGPNYHQKHVLLGPIMDEIVKFYEYEISNHLNYESIGYNSDESAFHGFTAKCLEEGYFIGKDIIDAMQTL